MAKLGCLTELALGASLGLTGGLFLFPNLGKHKDQIERQANYFEEGSKLDPVEVLGIQKILYAEAANQSSSNRQLIGRCILNRVESSEYPNTIYGVTHQRNAFTCITQNSKLWNQAENSGRMNSYERRIFQDCENDAKNVLKGKLQGIQREEEIVAYHDTSIKKPKEEYWRKLERVYSSGRLIFYAPKH